MAEAKIFLIFGKKNEAQLFFVVLKFWEAHSLSLSDRCIVLNFIFHLRLIFVLKCFQIWTRLVPIKKNGVNMLTLTKKKNEVIA